MFIDEDKIPHAFCLSESNIPLPRSYTDAAVRKEHSETVAEKVKDWVELIVEKHRVESSR